MHSPFQLCVAPFEGFSMSHSTTRWSFRLLLIVVALLAAPLAATAADESSKPVFLYSRYFNANGENRYLPDGQYRDVLARLREHFDVRVNDLPLNSQTLKDVAGGLVFKPNDKTG